VRCDETANGEQSVRMNKIGENLRRAAKERGLSAEAIARALHRDVRTVQNWMNGDRVEAFKKVERVCRLLGVTPNQLLDFEPADHQMEAAALSEGLRSDQRAAWFQLARSMRDVPSPTGGSRHRVARRA
jgi:transcriptional regulator with XRE-family HTH domain